MVRVLSQSPLPVPFTLDHLTLARAVFTWAARTRHPIGCGVPFSWAMYNFFMRNVIDAEKKIIGCQGKWAFPTFDAANHVAHKKTFGLRKARKPYHCEACGKFHLSGADSKSRRAVRKVHLKRMEVHA